MRLRQKKEKQIFLRQKYKKISILKYKYSERLKMVVTKRGYKEENVDFEKVGIKKEWRSKN